MVWGLSGVQHRRARCWTRWVTVPRVYPRLPGQGFVSEDEYLEITGITREQSGEYECSAVNDVAVPDVRKVKVTVNCKWLGWASWGGWGTGVGMGPGPGA